MSENPTRCQFSAEFKRETVDLTKQPGRTSTDIAHQLEIRPGSPSLHRATPSVLSDLPNGSPLGSLAQWLLPVAPASTVAAL